jgi:hypothetical protein
MIHQLRIELCPAPFTGSSPRPRQPRMLMLSRPLVRLWANLPGAVAYLALRRIVAVSLCAVLSSKPRSTPQLVAEHLMKRNGIWDRRLGLACEPLLALITPPLRGQFSIINNHRHSAERP